MTGADSAPLPLILLPGLGTDERLFALQKLQFPQLIVPPWLTPERRESLPDFAARMAASLPVTGPCIVGGVSFGGLVALEMTRHLQARGCVLISSLRGPRELPIWARIAAPGAWLLPRRADWWISRSGRLMLWTCGPILPRRLRDFCVHLSKTEAPLLPWACRAVVSWKTAADWPCPIAQLHGSADPIFPRWRVQADAVVDRGGHLLTLTHPFVVNEFLSRCVAEFSGDSVC